VPRPETSPLTVLGWLVICFALIPLLMGGRGEGQTLLVAGCAMTAVGVILVLVGRFRTVRAARAVLKT
jgi:hypothetical protein